jgi:lysophospholipase L1-like esterase
MTAQSTARYPTGQVGDSKRLPTRTVVALGDSTTAGTPGFRSPLEAPPAGTGDVRSQYAYWLMQTHPEWRVLNRGVNGERSDEIRARFRRDVVAVSPDAVILIAGVNDVYQGKTAEAVTHELEGMYEVARRAGPRGIPVVAGTILPYNTATAAENARMRTVNGWIRAYAAAHPHVTVCDTRAAVAAPDDPDLLDTSPDGLHPTPEGYRRMALALVPVLERVLAGRA